MSIETGLSDFHHLVVSVMKTTFKRKPPKVIRYRCYKKYDPIKYSNDLNLSLAGKNLHQIPHEEFDDLLMRILDKHAPLKYKTIRGTD